MTPFAARAERVAGTDTREAMATRTVRAAAVAAAASAAPGWLAVLSMPVAWHNHFGMPAAFGPWLSIALVLAGVAVAFAVWRAGPIRARRRTPGDPVVLPAGVLPATWCAVLALVAATQQPRSIAVLLPFAPLASGALVGLAARLSGTACRREILSAAGGVAVAGGLAGVFFGGHLGLVAKGSGMHRAAVWTAAYLALAAVNFVRAGRALPGDLLVTNARMTSAAAVQDGTAFSVHDIHVTFGANRVLAGATLEAKPGELVALVGGNGAGKSTLLRVAAGLAAAERGRVTVAGHDVTTLLPEERAAAGLAFIAGARPVFPDLTVMENLRVAAFRSHLTSHAFAEATAGVFQIVPALQKRARARAGVLSGGEQRLLAVAQMLYRRPAVILADELSLGLDASARVAVLDLLRTLAEQGVAVVVVDHDLPSLLSRATRAVLLSAGDIESYDKPEDLLTRRADLLPATFLAGANG